MIGAASMSANAGVRIGLSFGLPLPVPVVAAAVYAAPAPVVVACPPPVYTTAYVVQPACPGPQYVWVGGCWSVNAYGRFWVPGAWHYQGHPVVAAHFGGGYGYGNDRGGYDHGHGDYHR